MAGTEGSLLELAVTTALIGMAVVFAALFLLTVYMHYFKVFVAWMTARQPAVAVAPKAAPERKPSTTTSSSAATEPRVAAAVAVALCLSGVRSGAAAEVAAAIAVALALHGEKGAQAAQGPVMGWGLAGRMDTHAVRERMQRRAFRSSGRA